MKGNYLLAIACNAIVTMLHISTTYIWFVAILASICLSGCSRAQGLVGRWRTDAARVSPTGDPKKTVEAYQTAEFLKDGSFKMASTFTLDGNKNTGVFLVGTYALIDTNHLMLRVTSNTVRPDPDTSTPLTVCFTISGDQLEMDALTSSVVPERTKYRRVK